MAMPCWPPSGQPAAGAWLRRRRRRGPSRSRAAGRAGSRVWLSPHAVGVLDDHAEVARLRPALGVVGQLCVGCHLLGGERWAGRIPVGGVPEHGEDEVGVAGHAVGERRGLPVFPLMSEWPWFRVTHAPMNRGRSLRHTHRSPGPRAPCGRCAQCQPKTSRAKRLGAPVWTSTVGTHRTCDGTRHEALGGHLVRRTGGGRGRIW